MLMKKILPSFLIICLFVNVVSSYAVNYPSSELSTNVSGSVGEFYLNLYGYISPFASIVLTYDGLFLRSTVADEHGNFSITQVLIKTGFSHFCLDAIDFKRLGESLTCFSIPPAQSSITIRDIFLPPTIGLSRTEIAEGAEAVAFGYTMPGAIVTLHISGKELKTTAADSSGYYDFHLKNLKAGLYSLYATANYKSRESLAPTKTLKLRALSLWEQFLAFLRDLWNNLLRFFTSLFLSPLWLVVPIIILIIILILKLWPEMFTFIYQNRFVIFFKDIFIKKKKLHHAWWVGY